MVATAATCTARSSSTTYLKPSSAAGAGGGTVHRERTGRRTRRGPGICPRVGGAAPTTRGPGSQLGSPRLPPRAPRGNARVARDCCDRRRGACRRVVGAPPRPRAGGLRALRGGSQRGTSSRSSSGSGPRRPSRRSWPPPRCTADRRRRRRRRGSRPTHFPCARRPRAQPRAQPRTQARLPGSRPSSKLGFRLGAGLGASCRGGAPMMHQLCDERWALSSRLPSSFPGSPPPPGS